MNDQQEEPRNIVFAALADDPRARRPADGLVLGLSVIVVLLAGWMYRVEGGVDQRVLDLVAGDLPSWLSSILTVFFTLGGVYTVGLLVAIGVFAEGRRAVARDMALAAVLSVVAAAGAAWLGGNSYPDLFPEFASADGEPSYPVVRMSLSIAVLSVAGPYLSLPMRKVGRRLLFLMALGAVVLTYGTVSAVLGGIALGLASASVVRLIFGSGVGIPSLARVRSAMAWCGLDTEGVEYLADQPVGATLLRAQLDDRTEALVKVYGRDAAEAATLSRVWRSMWFTDVGESLTVSGMQQVEHEGLMLLEADRAGLSVPELVGWGRGDAGDALIATRWLDHPRLSDLGADQVSDEVLGWCWDALEQLHAADIAHRRIDATRLVLADGAVVLDDLSAAARVPASQDKTTDIAQMIATTAVAVGTARAVDAARASVSAERLQEALSMLQRSALSSDLQRQVKEADIDLKKLRSDVAEAIGAEPPDLVQLQRVSWGNVAMVVLTLVAASALISSLADIGLDTLVDQLADAQWSWIITALVLAQLTNVGEYISLTGMVRGPVPLGPTLMFRYALSFISLAVPSEAGAIAMNIRYMRKLGVSVGAATAQGPLLTVVAKSWDVLLLLLAGQVAGESIDVDDFDSGPVLRLILLVVVLAVVGVILVLVVPKLRQQVLPPVKKVFVEVSESFTDPTRLFRIVGGSLMTRLLFALTLSASVNAYGGSISFAEAVFVNSAVGLFVGFMPVPGGIGVGEAALTAGLTLVGVPEPIALAAAITHRMVTNYLPPIYGWYTTRWLTARDYL